ncbi:MAG: SpoIIIAH-like family protein [Clostridia bacterium]|jgi:stage III sporulation protein AH|nr:SpoIIIAH-like family protein [Clostridia bacterium]MDD4275416.1 SpoIIIAH-like family protein [Clostridia bacterium]
MLNKKTKIIVLSCMLVLLALTGYLNIKLNSDTVDTGTNVTASGFFDTYRSDRTSTRDQEMLYLEAIIASDSATETAVANAETGKMELVSEMETELITEGLIKAKGFTDCIVTISTSGVNVIVKCATLTTAEVAQIVQIIQEQTSTDIENIKIIPVE